MSAAFTPGRWYAWRPVDEWAVSTEPPDGSMPLRIAEEVNGNNDAEAETNARLIAAAPDLYAAASSCVMRGWRLARSVARGRGS